MPRSACILVLLVSMGCQQQPPPPTQPEPPAERKTVSLGTGKEKGPAFFYRPSGKGPFAALILVPDEKGMAGWVKKRAEKLATDHVVLALDLPGGKQRPDDRRVLAEIKEAVDYLVARPDVRAQHIGVIGWGQGGGAALDAVTDDTRLRAVVDLDGPLLCDPKKLHRLEASILVILAGKGTNADREAERFREALEKADRRADSTPVYLNCGPGFLNPTSAEADQKVIENVWDRITEFLLRNLDR